MTAPPRALPQPIPYQGSKRRLAAKILTFVPRDVDVLYEPFVGSGAITIAAAARGGPRRFVVGDSLSPLAALWSAIVDDPVPVCDGYEHLWTAGRADPRAHFDRVREEYNRRPDPVRLLYLVARCVKNAVRFNGDGGFNQSPDLRRLGTNPRTLSRRMTAVHALLRGRARVRCCDYAQLLRAAGPGDLVYLDPPYLGVTCGRDARYHEGLDLERFVAELARANARGTSFLVSFDGRTGDRMYAEPLPARLGLLHVELDAGRSSQATLNGRKDRTVESLYLSPALRARLRS